MCVPKTVDQLTRELELHKDVVRFEYKDGPEKQELIGIPVGLCPTEGYGTHGYRFRSLARENGEYRLNGYVQLDPFARVLFAEKIGTAQDDAITLKFPPRLVTTEKKESLI